MSAPAGHRIRPARSTDAGRIAAIYAPYVTGGTISFELEAPDAATIQDRMAQPLVMPVVAGVYDTERDPALPEGLPWLVAEDEDGVVQGYAYAHPFDRREAYCRSVETTVYLATDACGRGLGRRLYGALIGVVTALGHAQAVGRISMPNDPSVALHAAMGFRRVGRLEAIGRKDGRWIDVELWQRPLAAQPR